MQYDLLPAPPAYSRGTSPGAARCSDTSVAAAASVAPTLGARQAAVVDVVRRRGGATCAEVAAALGLPMHAVSGRITELRLQGRLADSGARRIGTSGRAGAVWVEVGS
jgi:predicted ArsR family transcriptional regulator